MPRGSARRPRIAGDARRHRGAAARARTPACRRARCRASIATVMPARCRRQRYEARRTPRASLRPKAGLPGRQRDAARGRDRRPAGRVKLPGPAVTPMRSSAWNGRSARRCIDARDQRHQRFGMAALHRQRFGRHGPAALGVDDSGGAGFKRGVDGQDAHAHSILRGRAKECPAPYATERRPCGRRIRRAAVERR